MAHGGVVMMINGSDRKWSQQSGPTLVQKEVDELLSMSMSLRISEVRAV